MAFITHSKRQIGEAYAPPPMLSKGRGARAARPAAGSACILARLPRLELHPVNDEQQGAKPQDEPKNIKPSIFHFRLSPALYDFLSNSSAVLETHRKLNLFLYFKAYISSVIRPHTSQPHSADRAYRVLVRLVVAALVAVVEVLAEGIVGDHRVRLAGPVESQLEIPVPVAI